ncbi:MAG: SPOR domain-containing protein [Bacteroidota bacterium]
MDKYLLLLLKEVNTIIIPGLGALTITNAKTGEIMFMSYLKYDDGKLATYIAEKENWDLNDAKNLIAKYVREVLAVLDRGESYEMYGFGTFLKDKNGDLNFANWDGNLPSERNEILTEIAKENEPEQKPEEITIESSTFEESGVEVEMNEIDVTIESSSELEIEPSIVFETTEINEEVKENLVEKESKNESQNNLIISLGPNFELSIENGDIIEMHKKTAGDNNNIVVDEPKIESEKSEEPTQVEETIIVHETEIIEQKETLPEQKEVIENSPEIKEETSNQETIVAEKEEAKEEAKVENIVETEVEEKKKEKREKLERPSRLERPERPERPARDKKVAEVSNDKNEEKVQPVAKEKNKKEAEVVVKPKLVVHKTINQIKSMKLAAIIIGIGLVGGLYLLLFNSDDISTPVEPDKKELADNNKNIQQEEKVETKEESAEEVTTTVVEELETTEVPEVESPVEEPVQAEKTKPLPKPTVVSTPQPTSNAVSGTYHIIAGSFGVSDNANHFAEKMKEKGYDAQVLGQVGQMFIVSIGSYSSKDEAVQANHKNEVKGWIHRKH